MYPSQPATPIQQQLSQARKQITGKSSIGILREQVAAIWSMVTTTGHDIRKLVLLVEASQDTAAHLAQQRQIQDQAAELVELRQALADLQYKSAEESEGGSFF